MEKIGRYEILEELGRGAMGVVYKARDPQIGRTVAIKVILTANLSAEDIAHYKQRFMREARAAGQMSHPGIVTIHDIAEDANGQPYLVMEFIEGQTLERMLLPPSKPPGDSTDSGLDLPAPAPRLLIGHSLDIGIQLAEALEYAHRRGVIHRDIKPSNIMITSDGRAKITDFGIAKLADSAMTQTHMRMGTPAFMSPEQVSGTPLDFRSDIFSLGSVLYWMFTGERPFPGESITTIVYKVVFSEPLPPSYVNRALPKDLDIVISRCLAKNAEDRYPSCKELAEDLRAVKEKRPIATTRAPAVDQTAILETKSPLASIVAGLPPEEKAKLAAIVAGEEEATVRVGARPAPPARPDAGPEAPKVIQQAEAPAAAPAAQPEAAPRGKQFPTLVTALASAAVIILVVAGYLLWPRISPAPSETAPPQAAAQISAPPAASTAPPAQGATESTAPAAAAPPKLAPPAESQPAAESSAPTGSSNRTPPGSKVPSVATSAPTAGKSRATVLPKSAAMSTLLVDCSHNFKSASLTILTGKTVLLQEIITEKEKRVRRSVPIPAGERVIVVRVESADPKFSQEKEEGGIFTEGMARTLTIGFGRGSGLGLTERKLSLKLGDNIPAPASKGP
jgi:serine/threonine-protein kinase